MNLPIISQLPQDAATAVLILLLVVAFIIAFKIMKMVFETITVSILSAGFYAALSQVLAYSFSFNQMLTYAFLGAVLYMAYSFMASAYTIAKHLLEIPYQIIVYLLKPVKMLYSEAKKEYKLWRMRKEQGSNRKDEGDDDSGTSTKEVVIDKVNKDDD